MKRHRITNIYISTSSPGFGVLTSNGNIYFPVGQPRTLFKLKKHLPHKYKELTERNGLTEEALQELLIGKYVYGTSKEEASINGMSYRVLI